MVTNLPGSEVPDVRDYLYVDTTRVRSLLAQINDGVLDEQASSQTRSQRLRAGIKQFGFDRERGESSSESMSMADLHVSMLEESAEAHHLLTDISDRVRREKDWLRGKVRNHLQPGMLLRVNAPTVIADPQSLMTVFRGMQEATGDEDEEFEQFIELMAPLYGSAITVSIRPTADQAERAAFVGAIPANHGFAPLDRDLILARVGPTPQDMTCLIQVARVPTQHDSGQSVEAEIARLTKRLTGMGDDEALDREVLDGLIANMADLMERTGLAAAPKWPAVSVVPLAIYRHVLPIPDELAVGSPQDC